jgi:hypothetical protein
MQVRRNTEGRSCNHFRCGRAISVIQLVCILVELGKENAIRKYVIVLCGLPLSTTFFPNYLINGTIFEKKVIEHKMCASSFSKSFV